MSRDSEIPGILPENIQREGIWMWLGTVFMLAFLSMPASAAQVRVLHGQIVRIKLHNVLTTENVVKGDMIDFDVAEDVVVATHVVIQKGAPARGKVVAVKGAGKKKAKDASVTLQFVSVRSVDSQDLPLRARPDKIKKAESKENEIEANDLLPGYADRVIGAAQGKEYAAYLDESVTVRVPDIPVAAPPLATTAPASSVQTNPQVETQASATAGQIPSVRTEVPVETPAEEEQASVDFNSDPPGADILIDEVLVGNTPSILQVREGRHIIQLRIGGYRSWTRTLLVNSGSHVSIRATLEKQ